MVNKVILVGNLGRDAEIRNLPNGSKVARFPLATNENFKDKNGMWQTVTDWHDIVAWRTLADRAERDCKKGKMVFVEGKLRRRKYTDQNGVERVAIEIEADMIRLLERKEYGEEGPIKYMRPNDRVGELPIDRNNEPPNNDFEMLDDNLPF